MKETALLSLLLCFPSIPASPWNIAKLKNGHAVICHQLVPAGMHVEVREEYPEVMAGWHDTRTLIWFWSKDKRRKQILWRIENDVK